MVQGNQSGEWPQLTNTQKVVVGLGLITALAVVTVATAGTGTALACAAMGALEGAATGAVTGGMNSPHCFVAGTLVCTIDGEVPIEDIEVGDYVLAENPDTGEIDYNPVLETYEHYTYDVVYLTIDGEEFTTTEGHPFLRDLANVINSGVVKYEGLGTLKKGMDAMKIYRGMGVTIVTTLENEFVTILKSGEGLALSIIMK